MSSVMIEMPEPTVTPTVVVGVCDACGTVERISVGSSGLVGLSPVELVGSSLPEEVHPADRGSMLQALTRATNHRTSIALELHMGRPGRWHRVRVMIAPMAEGGNQLGFVISTAHPEDPSPRTGRLEQHLRRIAQELEAAGIDVRRDDGLALDLLPGSDELSPRQWEVLRRLLRGERVPGIARDLYLSASTVRNHLAAIFAKFGVHSQEELITALRRPTDNSVMRP